MLLYPYSLVIKSSIVYFGNNCYWLIQRHKCSHVVLISPVHLSTKLRWGCLVIVVPEQLCNILSPVWTAYLLKWIHCGECHFWIWVSEHCICSYTVPLAELCLFSSLLYFTRDCYWSRWIQYNGLPRLKLQPWLGPEQSEGEKSVKTKPSI